MDAKNCSRLLLVYCSRCQDHSKEGETLTSPPTPTFSLKRRVLQISPNWSLKGPQGSMSSNPSF